MKDLKKNFSKSVTNKDMKGPVVAGQISPLRHGWGTHDEDDDTFTNSQVSQVVRDDSER